MAFAKVNLSVPELTAFGDEGTQSDTVLLSESLAGEICDRGVSVEVPQGNDRRSPHRHSLALGKHGFSDRIRFSIVVKNSQATAVEHFPAAVPMISAFSPLGIAPLGSDSPRKGKLKKTRS